MIDTGAGKDTVVGLISDTHGLLRPEAARALAGAQRIVHAGDIGKPAVLQSLGEIAPVEAVRGNNDIADWATDIPEYRTVTVEGVNIYVIHDLQELERAPVPHDAQVIVSGHSHRPAISERGGMLFVNPGSAGRRRFSLPVTLGLLHIRAGIARAEIVQLL
jgi:putative phosphoesterase